MQASLQMTVFFDLCIGRSPFSEMEPQRGDSHASELANDCLFRFMHRAEPFQ